MYAKPMYLNEKVGNSMPVNFDDSLEFTELYGIEVELEGKGGIAKPTDAVLMDWVTHNDGSLRKLNPGDEAIEYVTKVPRTKIRTIKSLKTLIDFLTSPGKQVYDSYRTSIHVHVNCMADKMIHVYNFITLCIIFDELLASQNGEHRVGNNFCLRARDAQGQINNLIESINVQGSFFGLNGNWRYSAINFASLCKFGTVEFRSLECTTDLKRIVDWINVIDNLKQASRQFDNPQQIIRGFSQSFSVKEFCKQVLGDMSEKYTSVMGYDRMLFEGMRLAQDFAFCSKWMAKDLKSKPNPEDKLKKLVKGYEAQGAWPGVAVVAAQGQNNVWVQNYDYMAAAHAELDALAQAAAPPPQPAYQLDPIDDDDNDEFFDDLDDEDLL